MIPIKGVVLLLLAAIVVAVCYKDEIIRSFQKYIDNNKEKDEEKEE